MMPDEIRKTIEWALIWTQADSDSIRLHTTEMEHHVIMEDIRHALDWLEQQEALGNSPQDMPVPVVRLTPERIHALEEIIDIASQAGPYAGDYFDEKWGLTEGYKKYEPVLRAMFAELAAAQPKQGGNDA